MRHALAVTAALAVFLGACASGNIAKARQISLAALKVNVAAIDAFKKFDYEFQKRVVEKALAAGTEEALAEAEKTLAFYRMKRAEAIEAFEKVQAVVGFGNALIPLVESGVNREEDLLAWMAQLATAVKELQQVLQTFGMKLPFTIPF
jgi:hypothetical protein